jgi:hypothetical protein
MLQFPPSHAALRMHADAYVPHGMRVHKTPSYIHTHISSCPMLIFVSSHSHHAQDLELQKNTHHNQVHVAVSTDVPPSNTRTFRATSDRRKTGRQTLSWGSVDVRMISPHKHEEHQTCDGPNAEVTPCLCGTLWHTCPLIQLSRSHGIYVCVYQRIAMSSLSSSSAPSTPTPSFSLSCARSCSV